MDKKKVAALVCLIVVGALGGVLSSPYGSNPTVHSWCEFALKVLALAGFTVPISVYGGETKQSSGLVLPPPPPGGGK